MDSISDAFFVLEAVYLVHLDIAEPEAYAVLHGFAVGVVLSEHEVVTEPSAGQFLSDLEEGEVLFMLKMQVIDHIQNIAVLGYPKDVDVFFIERDVDFAVF